MRETLIQIVIYLLSFSVSWILYSLFISFPYIFIRFLINIDGAAIRRQEQIRINKIANQILTDIQNGINGKPVHESIPYKFCLYLRAFSIEDKISQPIENIPVTGTLIARLLSSDMVCMDYSLQKFFNERGMFLVKIGLPSERPSAGVISTDDSNWRNIFKALAEKAHLIVIVPGLEAGIREEINWLISSKLIAKSIFLKPNRFPRRLWERIRKTYANQDHIIFPQFCRNQFSFRVMPDGFYNHLLTSTWRRKRRLFFTP